MKKVMGMAALMLAVMWSGDLLSASYRLQACVAGLNGYPACPQLGPDMQPLEAPPGGDEEGGGGVETPSCATVGLFGEANNIQGAATYSVVAGGQCPTAIRVMLSAFDSTASNESVYSSQMLSMNRTAITQIIATPDANCQTTGKDPVLTFTPTLDFYLVPNASGSIPDSWSGFYFGGVLNNAPNPLTGVKGWGESDQGVTSQYTLYNGGSSGETLNAGTPFVIEAAPGTRADGDIEITVEYLSAWGVRPPFTAGQCGVTFEVIGTGLAH